MEIVTEGGFALGGVGPSFPQLKMLEDLLDDLLILDEGDDLHPPLALRTHQGVHLRFRSIKF
jgi:hypothetical protein